MQKHRRREKGEENEKLLHPTHQGQTGQSSLINAVAQEMEWTSTKLGSASFRNKRSGADSR
jgi:hypothetical protein